MSNQKLINTIRDGRPKGAIWLYIHQSIVFRSWRSEK